MNDFSVVIVAGGENTRFNEMSIFPKILLPTLEYPSILSYDCKLFSDHDIYLIINDRYYDMVRQYVDKTKLKITKIIKTNNHDGSANTIKSVISELPEKCLFVWSDLILDQDCRDSIYQTIEDYWSMDYCKNINFIFTYNGEYRFKVTENIVLNSINKQGNVPGIYYTNHLGLLLRTQYNYYKPDYDLIEIFKDNLNVERIGIECQGNITEFRDLDVYKEYYKNEELKTQTRFFNTMEVNDGKLTKTCINENYNKLIDREIDWYEECTKLGYENIPKVYKLDKENHSFTIEYLKGYCNIYEFIKDSSQDDFDRFMDTYLKAVEDLHKLSSRVIDRDIAEKNCWVEFYDKVIKRCDSISAILYDYDSINLSILLSKALTNIIELLGDDITTYCFGHGDLNGSNVMYNQKKNDIKFIDPRGYFGHSFLCIPPCYDYAKIMYCLSGYDNFNNGRYKFTKDWYDEPKQLKEYDFGKNHRLYLIIVGITWIALAEYISQDVFKANIAYRHGIKLLNQALR